MTSNIIKIASLITASACAALAAESAAATPSSDASAQKEINTIFDIPASSKIFENFSGSLAADYESEFIFRGKQLAGNVVSPSVDLGYDIGSGFAAYVGWWGCYSTDEGDYTENDLYAGITYTIENFTVDFGYTAYLYPSGSNENELKLALSYDTSELLGDFAVSPYVAGYYNLTYSGTVIEAGLSYSAPVTKWLIGQNWGTLDIAGFGGYADYCAGMSDHGGYAYAGASIDAGFAISETIGFSIGARYACNNDGDDGYAAREGKENNLWFGVKTSLSF